MQPPDDPEFQDCRPRGAFAASGLTETDESWSGFPSWRGACAFSACAADLSARSPASIGLARRSLRDRSRKVLSNFGPHLLGMGISRCTLLVIVPFIRSEVEVSSVADLDRSEIQRRKEGSPASAPQGLPDTTSSNVNGLRLREGRSPDRLERPLHQLLSIAYDNLRRRGERPRLFSRGSASR